MGMARGYKRSGIRRSRHFEPGDGRTTRRVSKHFSPESDKVTGRITKGRRASVGRKNSVPQKQLLWSSEATRKIKRRQKAGKSPDLPEGLFSDGSRDDIIKATLFGLENWRAVGRAKLVDLRKKSKQEQENLLIEGQKRIVFFINRQGRNLDKMANKAAVLAAKDWYERELNKLQTVSGLRRKISSAGRRRTGRRTGSRRLSPRKPRLVGRRHRMTDVDDVKVKMRRKSSKPRYRTRSNRISNVEKDKARRLSRRRHARNLDRNLDE